MANEQKRDWRELCQKASKEQDSKRLMALISELMKALDENNITGRAARTEDAAA